MSAGWYPDPDRTPGRERWWDGRQWSAATRPALGPLPREIGARDRGKANNRRSTWWVAGAVLAVLVLVLVAPAALRSLGGVLTDPDGSDGPPSTQVCPLAPTYEAPTNPPVSGRVASGRISVVDLGDPWSAAVPEPRVPYGRGFVRQEIPVDDDPAWVTSVQVGTIVAGDGFATPEQGVHLIVDCLLGDLYNGIPVQRHDISDEPVTVDGHAAHRLETDLTFEVEGLDFTHERFVIVLIDLADGTCAAYLADIPAPASPYLPDIARAERSIRIS